MRAIPFSLQYSQSHLLLSSRHINKTSLPLFPPFSNPSFRPSFSNTRIYTQTKAKKAETGNGNNSLPAFDPDPSLSQQKLLQVVLVSPQPLGFKVDDIKLKRVGLDYWPYPPLSVFCTYPLFDLIPFSVCWRTLTILSCPGSYDRIVPFPCDMSSEPQSSSTPIGVSRVEEFFVNVDDEHNKEECNIEASEPTVDSTTKEVEIENPFKAFKRPRRSKNDDKQPKEIIISVPSKESIM